MKKTIIIILSILFSSIVVDAKTLIVYYSYTNNVESIVKVLAPLIDSDVIEIEPSEKGLDYAANNYAIGSSQISAIRNNPNDAASYPPIDKVDVNLEEYDTIIIGAPLWWSQMAAPMQTYLFQFGKEMAGKKIGLIVSSHTSGISGVEDDAKRLIPDGKFLTPSLWIRSAQTPDAESLLENWLKDINYKDLIAEVNDLGYDTPQYYTVYSLNGVKIMDKALSLEGLKNGFYIINGRKISIKNQ